MEDQAANGRRTLGGGLVMASALLALCLLACLFAAVPLRRWLGSQQLPPDEGPEPMSLPASIRAQLPQMPPPGSGDGFQSQGGRPGPAPIAGLPPGIAPAPGAAGMHPPAPAGGASSRSAGLSCELAFHLQHWDEAAGSAQRWLTQTRDPLEASRASAIAAHAPRIKQLFERMDAPGQLVRNYDTSLGLVRIATGAGELLAVALAGGDAGQPQVVEEHAVEGIQQALRQGRPLQLLVKAANSFIPTTLPPDATDVRPVDQAAIHERLESALRTRLQRMRSGADQDDALAWYAAGVFAYQNRLDDLVSGTLEQAVQLDPQLLRSVREDAATPLAGRMAAALRVGGQRQAGPFARQLRERYADTRVGQQALLLYAGKTQELLTLSRDQAAPTSGQAPARTAPERAVPAPGGPLSAAEAQSRAVADAEMAAGAPLLQKAEEMGPVEGRNAIYGEALGHFRRAQRLFAALLERHGEDAELNASMVEANVDVFACLKGVSSG